MKRAAACGRAAVACLGLALAALPARAAWREPYPASPPGDVVDTLHGVAVPDPWRWLEDGRSPEVQNWTDAQNAVTRRALEGVQGRDRIRAELQRLYRIPTLSAPRLAGTRLFWQKREEGQDQPVVWVNDGATTLGPHVAIDPNRLSYDGTTALDWVFPSPDGKMLAYGTSVGGTEHSTLRVFNVITGFDTWDTIPNTQHCTVAWDPDGSGFLYSRYASPGEVPEGKEVLHQEIYHHRLMDEWQSDRIAYHGENAPLQERREVTTSADRKWTFLRTSVDWIRNDLYIRHAGTDETWRPVALGQDGQVFAEVVGTRLLLLTNAGAPRFHVIETDVNSPVFGGREMIPQQRGVIRGMSLVGDRLVLRVEEDAQVRLRVYASDGAFQHEVPLPAPGDVAEVTGEADGADFYFTYTSYVYPPTVYRCNVVTNEMQPLERFITGFDPLLYSVRE
ncbi:MAG TPA: hypothetical protein VLV15_09265, partial [Dongiaceae bacterium]|nr:hypothetical protein [Dongiaceae bacterium]